MLCCPVVPCPAPPPSPSPSLPLLAWFDQESTAAMTTPRTQALRDGSLLRGRPARCWAAALALALAHTELFLPSRLVFFLCACVPLARLLAPRTERNKGRERRIFLPRAHTNAAFVLSFCRSAPPASESVAGGGRCLPYVSFSSSIPSLGGRFNENDPSSGDAAYLRKCGPSNRVPRPSLVRFYPVSRYSCRARLRCCFWLKHGLTSLLCEACTARAERGCFQLRTYFLRALPCGRPRAVRVAAAGRRARRVGHAG